MCQGFTQLTETCDINCHSLPWGREYLGLHSRTFAQSLKFHARSPHVTLQTISVTFCVAVSTEQSAKHSSNNEHFPANTVPCANTRHLLPTRPPRAGGQRGWCCHLSAAPRTAGTKPAGPRRRKPTASPETPSATPTQRPAACLYCSPN